MTVSRELRTDDVDTCDSINSVISVNGSTRVNTSVTWRYVSQYQTSLTTNCHPWLRPDQSASHMASHVHASFYDWYSMQQGTFYEPSPRHPCWAGLPEKDSDFNPLIATLIPQSNGPSYSNTMIGTLAVDGWAVIANQLHAVTSAVT